MQYLFLISPLNWMRQEDETMEGLKPRPPEIQKDSISKTNRALPKSQNWVRDRYTLR